MKSHEPLKRVVIAVALILGMWAADLSACTSFRLIEFIKGKMSVHDNPLGVLTNAPTFDWHVTNLQNYINLTATAVPPFEVV